jgi:deoxyribonuclease IV
VSVAGGLCRAVEHALRRGCDALQIFPSNPRGWAVPDPDLAEEAELARRVAELAFPLFLHAPYLINLSAPDPAVLERSIANLAFALERGARLAADGVVVHTGSARGDDRGVAVRRAAATILGLVEQVGGVDLVVELTAGSGFMIAGTVTEAAELLDACDRHPRVKVCLDTCHLYAAGVDFTSRSGLRRLRADLRELGPDRVSVIHVNDSRDPLGSRRDRHARVGTGTIGLEPMRALLSSTGLHGVPLVLETPGTLDEQAHDVALVRSLGKRTRS